MDTVFNHGVSYVCNMSIGCVDAQVLGSEMVVSGNGEGQTGQC